MNLREEKFFKDIVEHETFYVAIKDKKFVKHQYNGEEVFVIWTEEALVHKYLDHYNIEADKVVPKDIDAFTTYERRNIFDEEDEILVNVTNTLEGHFINVVEATDEIVTVLNDIRLREFTQDVANTDRVIGLTNKETRNFITVTESDYNVDFIPVWSLSKRAEAVKDADFEECDLIDVEGEVFSEWLDGLRDDDKYVAIDLKPGVVGTIVSAQRLANELTF
ncbi:DUF2750 domain-containing protein [Staphylococcus massiliensis]|uniref:DUF2750 domain-containing protein n=1 Tax=Staphylococcus massiliensis S46 TaxID=1229783 RepID=K9AIR5_9STAP|nr:DUF2750 domain-containing protein [Staphylococcus massiliensis]EKU47189.1 hypothetical protein C273_08112 [Staphylococcus massiliensis S46]MCG3400195.1 DUF2750 domain-containing protein [Staphylococcus massiliensis]MCG3402762.1 DUF2750 domain-containing protein [Staphylococcus massiliensis]MCG3413246.1 DUF2750 domain-containing protein [Staphylococcus massiliensis]PNZ99839.1 DUF2750 domain-containing protein [Staphylococcus massiliensis CCUG 55927]